MQTNSNTTRTPFANIRFVAYKDYGNIGIEETVSDQNIQLYPNPVNSVLELKVENYQNLHYQLFDLNGRLLLQNELHEEITGINVTHLQPATYLLSVNNGNNTMKTFKFVKQ